jgi:hypothetical protein
VTGVPIVLALAAAALAAATLRLPSLLTTLLAGYLALVVDFGAVTWALSPFHAVTIAGLTAAEAVLLAAAVGGWWLRGRPGIELAGGRAAVRSIASDPVTVIFLGVLAVVLLYELVLGVTVPPNNWDSLTYHLARVAAWHQSDGIHWIANAPTGRLNEFQPLAEQQILFLFVATGSTALFALPQYVAQLAIILAVYGVARRLGYGAAPAARAAALVATLSLVALESTTAQNDLVAASFPIVAAYLLLGRGGLEELLAGVAIALGLGVKLTTALSLPVLVLLAWRRGRRTLIRTSVGAAIGLLAVSAWGYVLNIAHTGHILGHGQGRVEDAAALSLAGTVRRTVHLVYRLVDLGVTPHWLIAAFAAAGVAVAAIAAVRTRSAFAAVAAIPLLTPAFVLLVLHVISAQDPAYVPRAANEDLSGFGPLGLALLVGAPLTVAFSARARSKDPRRIALALGFPVYIVLLALTAKYNVWITRFMVVPVVLTAPLFAGIFRSRIAALAVIVVAGATVGLTLTHDADKKINGTFGRPWNLSQVQALDEFSAQPTGKIVAASLAAYDRLVPPRACVGAVLDPDEPAYLLWGPQLRHRVFFLPSLSALRSAYRQGLEYVVISTGVNAPVSKQFADARWTVKPLGTYWQLAQAPAGRPVTVLTTC